MKKQILGALLTVIGSTAMAENITVAGFDYAPFTILDGNKVEGVGWDLIQDITKDLGLTIKDTQVGSVTRVMEVAQAPNVLVTMLTRGPDREDKFHWLGQIAEDTNCFFTTKEAPITTLEEAKKAKVIGTNAGGASMKFLTENGFTNLDAVSNNQLNYKKVVAGRVQGWFTSDMVSRYSVKKEGGDISKFVCSGSFKKPTYWLAVSKSTDEALVKKLKAKVEEMEKAGKIKAAVAKYL